MPDSGSSPVGKIEFDMGILVSFESLQDSFMGCSENVVYFMNLIELVLAWEQWEETQDFEENAAHSPDVHFVVVVALGEETLRGSVPSGGDILGMPLPLHSFATTKINQLYLFVL